jgi:molecular chaperone DnaJ
MTEVVGRMWSNLWGASKGNDGEHLKYTVSITLEDVAQGVTKEIKVPRFVGCRACAGAKALPEDRVTCEACQGSGRSRGSRLFRTSCYHCGGQGFTATKPCPSCSGEGRIGREDVIKLKVPQGVATGQKLKLAGKGNEPVTTGATGDLFVVINVADHRVFRRRGEDLLLDLPITYAEAVLGADITVPTLQGQTVIRIPPGTPHGKVFRLGGRGLPQHRGGARGDLHLVTEIQIPDNLNQAEKTRLTAWAASLAPERHPRRTAFDRAIEER